MCALLLPRIEAVDLVAAHHDAPPRRCHLCDTAGVTAATIAPVERRMLRADAPGRAVESGEEDLMAPSEAGLRRLIVAFALVLLLATACSPTPTGTPSPSASASQGAQATPTPALADTIYVAIPSGGEGNFQFGPLSNATSSVGDDYEKAGVINVFLHDALYRYDEHLRPVPSLARSCDPSADGLIITCALIDATFQNGDPVTADDVVFTYRLMNANTHVDAVADFTHGDCVTAVNVGDSGCLWEVLDSVTKVDERTVAFHLQRVFTPFYTLVLPSVWIDSEKVVRASYERLRGKLAGMASNDLADQAGRLSDAVNSPAGDCAPLLQESAQMAAQAGLFVPDRAEYAYLPAGQFDACGYAITLMVELAQAAASLGAADETTAIALVYPELDIGRAPVGAGPYRLTGYEPNKRVTLEAWPGFHGGAPATKTFVFDLYADDDATAKAVARGDAAWLEDYYNADAYRQLKDLPSLRLGHPANPFYATIMYNVRTGQLFSDVRLRQALELCIDKPSIAAAATDGRGVPAYSEVAPGTWASDDQIPKPARDVPAATALVEAAGWARGSDGIYAKGGKRLAATIYVRHDASDRFKFAQNVALEARDCGMDLQPTQGDFGGGLRSILTWPNHAPDSEEPFDLYLVVFGGGWDPLTHVFASDAITTEANPNGVNFGGFSDPRLDELIRGLETTYDLNARADLFRQYQQIVTEEQPALFAWFQARLDAAAKGLRTVDGALDLDAPHWFAFPERLVLETSGGS
jgi:ABC-type transport system substrate-binding protein